MVQSDWYWATAIFVTFIGAAIAVAYYGGMFDEAARIADSKKLDKEGRSRTGYGLETQIKRVQVSNDPKFMETSGGLVG